MNKNMTYCQIRPDQCPQYAKCMRGEHKYIFQCVKMGVPIQLYVSKPLNSPDGSCSGFMEVANV